MLLSQTVKGITVYNRILCLVGTLIIVIVFLLDAVMPGKPAITVSVIRNELTECCHHVHCVVSDAAHRIVAGWGNVNGAIFPRSAIKPIQAIGLIESGAADMCHVADAELAIACGSHNGEPDQCTLIATWLSRMGFDATQLTCGAHMPLHPLTQQAMYRQELSATALHNNCSGKHAAMLITARHCGYSLSDYHQLTHPVQQRIAGILAELSDHMISDDQVGIDGCGVPTWYLPLNRLAMAAARFADFNQLTTTRAEACQRIRNAMTMHPYCVAGEDRIDTEINAITGGNVITKIGAEGVFIAFLCEAKLGLALKAEDGADRASKAALVEVLYQLDAITRQQYDQLAKYSKPEIKNWSGTPIGTLRVQL